MPMLWRSISRRTVALAGALIIAGWMVSIPLGLTAAATAEEPTVQQALDAVIAQQQAWHERHAAYATAAEIGAELNHPAINGCIYFGERVCVEIIVNDEGTAFLLSGRSDQQYAVATSAGQIYAGEGRRMHELNNAAAAVARAIAAAEDQRYATRAAYGDLSELAAEGLLSQDYAPVLVDGETQYGCTAAGVIFGLYQADTSHQFAVRAYGARTCWEARSGDDAVQETQLTTTYTAARQEQCQSTMRLLISAQAAYYSAYGKYGSLADLEAQRYLPDTFSEPPVDPAYGAVSCDVAPGGQSYRARITAGEIEFLGSETGEITQQPR